MTRLITWVVKFPWAKLVLREDSIVSQVRCMICLVVEGKDKLSPKLDML
jgi:hypothetical protein